MGDNRHRNAAHPPERSRPQPGGIAVTLPPRIIPSPELFAGSREIRILHDNEFYTLRQTARGKLLLTK
jgi:hemin uptake protein HemP